MNFSRKLPIGIQSFKDLREKSFLYVDKTEYLFQLVNSSKVYFLSRPRRFGKSLFLSTLAAYFLGQKELFTGLYLEKAEEDQAVQENRAAWEAYPVMYLDFDGVLNAFPNTGIVNYSDVGHVELVPDPDGYRTDLYSAKRAFPLDKTAVIDFGRRGFHELHWSDELAGKLYALARGGMLDLRWLSTWQPYTEMLGDRLGWDDSVVSSVFWHDPNTHEGGVMQKLDLIMNEIIKQRERVERGYDAHAIIWVDDGAINNRTITALIHTQLASPLLLISPDARIGISRRQLELIYTFVNRPPSTPCVIYSCPWDEKGHVIGNGEDDSDDAME